MQNFIVHEMESQVFPDAFVSWQEFINVFLKHKKSKENGEENSLPEIPAGLILDEEERDRFFMRYALHIAQCGRGGVNPNPLVGAVIVRDGKAIAAGYHQQYGKGHAEVNAFCDAQERGVDVRGADMYVTLEPCSHYGKTPPCADRIVKEGIGRVIIAMPDPNPKVAGHGMERIRQAGIEVKSGVMEQQAKKLNEVFLKYIMKKEPFVCLKMAMSLDGKIATKTGKSQWISCETSRKQVHYLRNNYMAIMVGIGTVLVDDPMLNCRLEGAVRQPVRIIADTHLQIPVESRLVKTARGIRTIVAVSEGIIGAGSDIQAGDNLKGEFWRTAVGEMESGKQKEEKQENKEAGQEEKIKILESAGVEILPVPERDGHINLNILTKKLGSMGIDGILLEGGPELAFAALKAGIVDKVRIYIAPKLIGGRKAASCISGEGVSELSEAIRLNGMKAYPCGEDIYLEGLVK